MPWWWSPLEPDSDAGDDACVLDVVQLFTSVVGSTAVGALPHHADVRRELAMELVTQAEAGLQCAEAITNTPLRIVLAPGFGFDQPLSDQAIGEQSLVLGLKRETGLDCLAEIAGRTDLQPVRLPTPNHTGADH